MSKKIYTREEFENLCLESAEQMQEDKELYNQALDVKIKAGHEYYWVHQARWFGEPCLQLTQDIMALQEVIYKSKPDYIIEIGVAWAGSLLFYSTIMEAIGGEGLIDIDVFIPQDLRERIAKHENLAKRIHLIENSSIEEETKQKCFDIIGEGKKVMVILDSHHTHDHVLKELQLYAELVKKDQYLIVSDTIIEYQPPADKRPRPWGTGNSPKTALDEYLKENPRFEVDYDVQNKLLVTNHVGGYLRAVS